VARRDEFAGSPRAISGLRRRRPTSRRVAMEAAVLLREPIDNEWPKNRRNSVHVKIVLTSRNPQLRIRTIERGERNFGQTTSTGTIIMDRAQFRINMTNKRLRGGEVVVESIHRARCCVMNRRRSKPSVRFVDPCFGGPFQPAAHFWLGLAFPLSIPSAFFSRCQVRVSVLPGGSRDWDFSLHADG